MFNMSNVRVFSFLLILSLIILALGFWVASHTGFLCALILVLLMNVSAYFFSASAVLSRFIAVPILPSESNKNLFDVIHTLCAEAKIAMPKLYMVDTPSINAFVVGRNASHASVVFTSGALSELSGEELIALISQALAHISNKRLLASTVAANFATFITILGNQKMWKFLFGFGNKIDYKHELMGSLSLSLLAPIASGCIRLLLPKSDLTGYSVDKTALRICGHKEWLLSLFDKLKSLQTKVFFEQAEVNPGTAHLFIVNPIKDKRLVDRFGFQETLSSREEKIK